MQASFAPSVTVLINPAYRISPPVSIPQLDEVPHHNLPFEDMELEKEVIEEAETTGARLSALDDLLGIASATTTASDKDDDAALKLDSWETAILKYTSKGLTREVAALALSAFGEVDAQVDKFAQNFAQMEQLGFSKHQITGALLLEGNDLDRAIARCCQD